MNMPHTSTSNSSLVGRLTIKIPPYMAVLIRHAWNSTACLSSLLLMQMAQPSSESPHTKPLAKFKSPPQLGHSTCHHASLISSSYNTGPHHISLFQNLSTPDLVIPDIPTHSPNGSCHPKSESWQDIIKPRVTQLLTSTLPLGTGRLIGPGATIRFSQPSTSSDFWL